MPLLVWQVLFFVFPLLFLVALSFWTVKNFVMSPDFDTVNWTTMYGRAVFWQAYGNTLALAATAAVLTSILAFPASYAIAFKMSDTARRWAVFLMVIPFFTSYLVRIYSWQIFLSDNGIINVILGWIGLGPYQMLNTVGATMIGYLTLAFPLVVLLQLFSLVFIDRTLIEAAHNMRCGRLRTVFEVVIPSARTGLVIAALFCFILAFGDFRQPGLSGRGGAHDPVDPDHRHHEIRPAVAPRGGHRADDDRHADGRGLRCRQICLRRGSPSDWGEVEMSGSADMNRNRAVDWALVVYVILAYAFVFAPIAASFVFSFNSDRFPSIPLGEFSLDWYRAVATDPLVWEGARNTLVVGLIVGVVSTALGFGAAYTDYRYKFAGKQVYLALALLPPTIPVIILGLAMLAYLSRINLSGNALSVIISHVVVCAPFAMAIIRLRLSQMDPALEPAAWNLGASEWMAMRHVIVPFCAPCDPGCAFHHHGGVVRRIRRGLVRLGPERDAAGQGPGLPARSGQPADQRDRHLRLHPFHDAGDPGSASAVRSRRQARQGVTP